MGGAMTDQARADRPRPGVLAWVYLVCALPFIVLFMTLLTFGQEGMRLVKLVLDSRFQGDGR